MSLLEKAKDYARLEKEIYDACDSVLRKYQTAELLRDGFSDRLFVLNGYSLDGFEIEDSYVILKASLYTGGGEYDYQRVKVPYKAFEDVDSWIASERKKITDKEDAEKAAKAEQERKDQIEAEKAEKELYEQLKSKYER